MLTLITRTVRTFEGQAARKGLRLLTREGHTVTTVATAGGRESDYLAKPIEALELQRVLAQWVAPGVRPPVAPRGPHP